MQKATQLILQKCQLNKWGMISLMLNIASRNGTNYRASAVKNKLTFEQNLRDFLLKQHDEIPLNQKVVSLPSHFLLVMRTNKNYGLNFALVCYYVCWFIKFKYNPAIGEDLESVTYSCNAIERFKGQSWNFLVTDELKNLQESCKFSRKILQENTYGFHLLARFLQVFRFTCKILARFLILLQESCKFFNSVTWLQVNWTLKRPIWLPRVASSYLSESCIWIQNLARNLQDSCKISHSKGVHEKSHLVSVLLIKNSDISHDIWISVSFSYQKHIIFRNSKSCKILARILQEFESWLIFFSLN